MSLLPGTRLGAYDIVGPLGAGGMGEVYRARDSRLGREVALKVLPETLVQDPDRVARFAREAQVLAALNHPNIAHIYAFEDGALSLELVEGPTLADRLAAGPLPIDEALAIAGQILEALEAAHAQGIVHRDLKPANIKVRDDGAVKVLDFGLAKLADPAVSAASVLQSLSPTITSPVMATGIGVILGTAAYMAPEQARGKAVDRRADIWAFGCVLYEMLTGRRAFDDEDVSLTLSRILQRDPDFAALPSAVPDHVRQLLALCLRKDPRRRLADVQDVRLVLQSDLAASTPASRESHTQRRGRAVAYVAAGLFAVIALAASVLLWRMPASPAGSANVIRFAVSPPADSQFPGANGAPRMAISPDGRYLAITIGQAGKPDQLWVRRLDTLELVPLTNVSFGAEGNSGEPVQQPFWSPDSRVVAFFSQGTMRKVGLDDRVVQTICKVPGNQFDGSWAADGTILFASSATKGLMRVSAGGGTPAQVTQIGKDETAHLWPRWLPDGRHYVYFSPGGTPAASAVYVGSVDGGAATRLFASPTMADFALPDLLLFVRDGALLAQHLDLATLRLVGEPVAVAPSVQTTTSGRLAVSASANGVMAFRPGTENGLADNQLAWVPRHGQGAIPVGLPSNLRGLDLAPDGRLAIVHREDVTGGDLWAVDFERGTQTRLTFDPDAHNASPVLLPDHRRMLFVKGATRAIYEKDITGVGSERLVYKSPGLAAVVPWAVSPDGATAVVSVGETAAGMDLATLPLNGGPLTPMTARPGAQGQAQFSPDGRWLAYSSLESGVAEIFIESFPGGQTRYQVSSDGGRSVRWRADGRELFFVNGRVPATFWSASVEPRGDGLRVGVPTRLFDATTAGGAHALPVIPWASTGDGSRFLITGLPAQANGAAPSPVTVVVNWREALKK